MRKKYPWGNNPRNCQTGRKVTKCESARPKGQFSGSALVAQAVVGKQLSAVADRFVGQNPKMDVLRADLAVGMSRFSPR